PLDVRGPAGGPRRDRRVLRRRPDLARPRQGNAREEDWATALADPAVRAAVVRLEAPQREVVVPHYGRPVPPLTPLDGFATFGAAQLPADDQRPVDPRHTMNGRGMWFFWAACCDACLRLAGLGTAIPAELWRGIGRGILVGLLNDGAVRGRF